MMAVTPSSTVRMRSGGMQRAIHKGLDKLNACDQVSIAVTIFYPNNLNFKNKIGGTYVYVYIFHFQP